MTETAVDHAGDDRFFYREEDKEKLPGCPGCGVVCGRRGCPVDEGRIRCSKCRKNGG